MFTSILNDRLKEFIEQNNILKENQAEFTAKHSTIDHIYTIKMLIDLFFYKKKKLFCAFIDYEKAFDKIWNKGLWTRLEKSGINKTSKFYNVITSMYNKIKSCVCVNNEKSSYFACNNGVRQGESLSPVLFNLHVNDFEEYLVNRGNIFVAP